MRIIKEGKKTKGVMRVTCKKCEAELEIMASDLEVIESVGTYEEPSKFSYKCPCCNREQVISKKKLSEDILFDLGLI